MWLHNQRQPTRNDFGSTSDCINLVCRYLLLLGYGIKNRGICSRREQSLLDAAAKKVGRQSFQNNACDPSVGLWVAGSHWWAAVRFNFGFSHNWSATQLEYGWQALIGASCSQY